MKTEKQIKEATLNKIIKFAYGDASITERIEIYFKMLSSKEIKKIYIDYKATAKAVHSIELENVELKELPNKNRNEENILIRFISLITLKPINISYASIVLVVGLITMFLLVGKNNEINYTQAQLSQAEQDFKYSLALVGKTFNEAEKKLNEDIVNKRIRKPLKIGFQTVNNLYK